MPASERWISFSWNLFHYSPSVQVITIIPGVYIVHVGISDTFFSIPSYTLHVPESYQFNKLQGHSSFCYRPTLTAYSTSHPLLFPSLQQQLLNQSRHVYSLFQRLFEKSRSKRAPPILQSHQCLPLLDKVKLQIYNTRGSSVCGYRLPLQLELNATSSSSHQSGIQVAFQSRFLLLCCLFWAQSLFLPIPCSQATHHILLGS